MKDKDISVAVIGLGYVGLPLANELAKNFKTIGYDTNIDKVKKLKNGRDPTNEVGKISKSLKFTSTLNDLINSNIYILCLPTPVNKNKKPDVNILKLSLRSISKIFKSNDTIILESTFYPGATEELVNKYLNKKNIKVNIGYSPERINPGDKKNTLSKITKIVSANNQKTLKKMIKIYGSLNKKKIYKAKSIRVAEAAKLIENVQRDLNIGLINELAKIFNKINLSIHDILDAANSKWNFLNFRPGLVGGHCIGVDPYYLKYLCEKNNFNPEVFIAARNTNEKMINYYYKIISNYLNPNSKILYLGLTFKENVNDLRNSKYLDLLNLISIKNKIHYYDPLTDDIKNSNKKIIKFKKQLYDVIIFAVPHYEFYEFLKKNINNILKKNGVFIDLNKKCNFVNQARYKYVTL